MRVSSMKYIWCLTAILMYAILLFPGCISTENAFGSSYDVEMQGLKIPARFFVIKESDGEYINNISFKKYSALLIEQTSVSGWKPSSYSDADTFLVLEYGVEPFYDTDTVIKPKYDQEKNSTTWVHTGAEIRNKPFVRITGLNAEDYRLEGKKTVLFTLLVTDPGGGEADGGLIGKMVIVASKALL